MSRFGGNMGPSGATFQAFAPEVAPDPDRPDPAAVAEMSVYDALPPEARGAFREARQQFSASDLRRQIVQGGCPRAIADALRAEGKLPWQVGTDGVLALTVLALDDKYTEAHYAEKAR